MSRRCLLARRCRLAGAAEAPAAGGASADPADWELVEVSGLPHREVAGLMRGAAFLVSVNSLEGFNTTVPEAMAAGCAVVASRVGGVPDVVQHGVNGLLVEPREPVQLAAAIARLLGEPAAAAALGRAARETIARRHSPDAAVRQLGNIYSDLGVMPVGRQPEQGIAA